MASAHSDSQRQPVKIPPHPPLSTGGILTELKRHDSTTAASEPSNNALKLKQTSPRLPKEGLGVVEKVNDHPLTSSSKGGILNEMVVGAELKRNDSTTAASERRITAIKLNHNSPPLKKGGRGDFLGSQPLKIFPNPPLSKGEILNEMIGVPEKGGIINEIAGAAGKEEILNFMAVAPGLKRHDSTTAASPTNNSVNLVNLDHSDSKRQRQPQQLNLKSTSIGKGNLTSSSFSQNFPFNYLPYPRLERSKSTTQTSQTNQPDLPANPRRSNPGEFFAEPPAASRTLPSIHPGRGQIRLPANFWERHYLHRIHWHLFIR